MLGEYLSIKQIAEKENKSIKTIRRLVAAEKIKVTNQMGKLNLIYKDDYEKWKKSIEPYLIDKLDIQINNEVQADDSKFVNVSKKMETIDGWKKSKRNGYKFIDIFSGAGGLSCGLVMAGFEPVGSVEIQNYAVETYKHNFIDSNRFPKDNVFNGDITTTEVKKQIIKAGTDNKVDIIVGGFPCQGFSMAGNRIEIDERNSLYSEMLEVVKNVKPKIVMMENVEGLRSMYDGKIEKKIIEDYQNIGYKISIHVLNSADYGVPQIRKRVIFIANRLEQVNLFPEPIYSNDNYITLGSAIEHLMEMDENKEINHTFTSHKKETIKKLAKVKEGESLYKNYSDAWKKSPWDKPSCTIKENHGGVNIHPKLPRVLTPRELATLQSFPDDFFFKGVKKWQLVQIGNAVPPLLAKAVGLSICEMLDKNKKK